MLFRSVAQAVFEHYRPRGAGDELPQSMPGSLLALAERFELLFSIYSLGSRPSGSSDPYGLRRAGNGIVQILWYRTWPLDVAAFLKRVAMQWQSFFPQASIDANELESELGVFLLQRVSSLMEEVEIDQDIVRSVTASYPIHQGRVLRNVCDAKERA